MEENKTMPNGSDAELAQVWDDFCDKLKAAKDVVFRATAPAAERDRAAGLRYLARNIALALDWEYENADPLHPELTHIMDWRRKFGGDNPDCLYLRSPINGSDTYCVSGTRGSVRFIAFTVAGSVDGPSKYAPVGSLLSDALHVDADGHFEVILSPAPPEPRPKNWMKTPPNTTHLTIRQFFADWENEAPIGNMRIDRLGPAAPPPDITVDSLSAGLRKAADYVHRNCGYWVDIVEMWQDRPDKFLPFRPVSNNANATPGGEPLMLYWNLPADEALIVRVVPPTRATFWNFECGNYWFETMDYRHRLSGTNCHHAVLEENGEMIAVLSHDDPGIPNWFDASGYAAGYIVCRWVGADSWPEPQVERVKRADLSSHLPATVKRIDASGRQEQLAAHRRGIMKRFANI